MSETAPERAPARRGGGNMLTQKLGPLATWVWLLIATVLVGGIALYLRHKQSTSGSSSTTTPAGAEANASQVPDIILQDYASPVSQTTTVTTPPAGSVPPPQPPPVKTKTPVKSTPPTKTKSAPPKAKPVSEPIFNAKYKVKKGQTLAEVAKQFGITREQLAHANGLGTGAGLRDGQELNVPSPAPNGKPNKAQ